jgi:septum site-determining protein MinD
MAGYVCTVAGGKGGVGKTTTAVNVAAALEADGYDVVVVDADLGMANLGQMLGLDAEHSLHEVLAGDATVSDALTETEGGVSIVPGKQSLEAFAEADPAKLRKVIKTLQNVFDVVLIDTGAGLSHETTVPLGLGDGVVLVTTLDDVAISDTEKTAQIAERVDGSVLGVLAARVASDPDTETLGDRFESPLLGVVPADLEATETEPLVLNSPDSDPAEAYERFADALQPVFFEGKDPADVETVYDPVWFGAEPESEPDPDPDDGEDDEDDEDGSRFGFGGLRTG